MKISEIESVNIQAVDLTQSKRVEDSPTKEEQPTLESGKKNKLEAKNNKETADKKQTKTVSKTIRVNIDRLDILMNLFEELVIDKGRYWNKSLRILTMQIFMRQSKECLGFLVTYKILF